MRPVRIVAATLAWAFAVAGPAATQAPVAGSRDVLTARAFDRQGDLRLSAVHDLAVDRDGVIWVGTDDGAGYFTGHEWEQVRMPRGARSNQVLAVLPRADGSLWFATRAGVIRTTPADTGVFDIAGGVASGDAVFDLIETRSFGAPTVLAMTSSGIARFDRGRFVRVPMPIELGGGATVAHETVSRTGVRELWVGSTTDGLFRMRSGEWERIGPEGGLYSFIIEALVGVAGSTEGSPRLYAAGPDGVFALRGERWRRDAGAPRRVVRMEHVPRPGGDDELWVGTSDGRLFRRPTNGRWEEVTQALGSSTGAVSVVKALLRADGDPAVYVGFRGERLIRFTLSHTSAITLPASLTERTVSLVRSISVGAREEIWLGTAAPGLLRLTRGDAVFEHPTSIVGPVRAVAQLGDTVWVAGRAGVARWVGGTWSPASQGLGPIAVRRFGRGTGAGAAPMLYAATTDGLWRWNGVRWVRVDLRGVGGIVDVVEAPGANGDPALFVAAEDGQIWQLQQGRARQTIAKRALTGTTTVTDLLVHRVVDGSYRVWAATTGLGGLRYLDPADPALAWHPVNTDVSDALPSDYVRALTTGPDGRLYAATTGGVAQIRIVSRDSVELETVYGDEEGLPSADVLTIAFAKGGDLLAGTRNGLGRLRPTVPARFDAGPLRLVVQTAGDAPPFDARGALRHDQADLVFDYSLLNYNREVDTRYRTELVGSARSVSDWSETHRTSLSALKPGRYVFRVWARDYRGQVSGPREFAFSVTPPPWATFRAIAVYIAAGLLLLAGLVRWRTRAVRRRALALEGSERQARASERKFRALFDRAFDAHLLIDDGRITAANAAALQLLAATSPTSLENQPLETAIPRLAGLDASSGGAAFETTVRRADGVEVPVDVASTPVPIAEGHQLLHVVLRDLSQQKAAERARSHHEQQLREAQKLESLGTLAGGIAHDFNNLLAVIRGTAELALEQEPRGSSSRSALATIVDAGDRARDLVRQILTFSRKSPRTLEPLDLALLLRELRPLIRSSLAATVRVELDVGSEPVIVVGDSTQLQQMMLNLCTNAAYAMRDGGGTLSIVLDWVGVGDEGLAGHVDLRPGRFVRLTVRDTGQGIPPDVLARIFEPFFTTKPTGEGTGLGLAVLHGVVASHRGSVAVQSVPGQGTTFEILIPAQLGVPVPVRVDAPAAALVPTTGGRLLVLDDDTDVLGVMVRLLRRLGFEVTGFTSPAEGLAWLRGHAADVDVVLTDQTMPQLTGDRVVVEVRGIRDDLPVIIMTGFSHLLTPEHVAALGAAGVLYKPVDRDALVHAITKVISGRVLLQPAPGAS